MQHHDQYFSSFIQRYQNGFRHTMNYIKNMSNSCAFSNDMEQSYKLKRNSSEIKNNQPNFNMEETLFQSNNGQQFKISQLISKAKGITQSNQQKIQKARRLRVSQKQATGTFVTGIGIYAEQIQPCQDPEEFFQVDQDALLRQLLAKQNNDDLEELRRMMKITKKNLNQYKREVCDTKKQVIMASQQFDSQMNFQLKQGLSRLKEPKKRAQSSAGFRKKK